MKWIGPIIAGVLLLIIAVLVLRGQSPLKNISNYRIYYGRMDDNTLEEMKQYDMIVVEALRFDKSMVENLQSAGVKVIGYMSVSEVGHWDELIVEAMGEHDWLYENGKIVKRTKNQLGDLQSMHFRTLILETIEKRIRDLGMDGVFFDTLDSLDVLENDEIRTVQAKGYIELVDDLRLEWEDAILIQNRGIKHTYLLDRGMIDGLLWENFSDDIMHEKVYKEWAKQMDQLRRFKNIRPMVLAYRNESSSEHYAKSKNWLFSYLPGQEGLMDWNLE